MAADPPWVAHQVIDVEIGALTPGLWCPSCALPSAGRAQVYVFTADDSIHLIGTYVLCLECHRFIYPGQPGWQEATSDPAD